MKQILLGITILISFQAFSQQDLQMSRLNNSCDTLVVKTSVWFNFGSGTTCPQLASYEVSSNSDTMELKLYYNVSGFWPQVGCEKVDTITSIILPNVTVLKGIAYSLSNNDSIITSTAQIEICSQTGVETIFNGFSYMMFPNPFSSHVNINYVGNEQITIEIYDFLSHKIISKTFTNNTSINTDQLSEGIYFYKLINEKGLIKSGKIIKE
jgi:hypothetical protein